MGCFADAVNVGVRDGMNIAIGADADDWSKDLRTVRVEEQYL